jgi:protein-tyrosine phosphatase
MEKGKTLVHCQAGLNRSGLVAAVALMKLGRTADEAIKLLRDSRSPMVLCNDTFVSQLHQLDYKMRENA